MTEERDLLVWLDMEMTGLDPEVCVPIEAAIVITSAELVELDAMETTIWQPDAVLDRMEPVVRRMHTENGLLERVRTATTSLGEAQKRMLAFLARWCKPQEGVLAGNSIHQDRRFLVRYFPAFDGYLHYRMVDVSTIKELVRRWYGPEALPQKMASTHTALADVRHSIEELRHYRTTVMKSPRSN
ncbi:MAG: oligoribonuclease [Deltaproteobacteria bacterium]|nr:oligoribonuclease [Deltaproteobacteria bacterium]